MHGRDNPRHSWLPPVPPILIGTYSSGATLFLYLLIGRTHPIESIRTRHLDVTTFFCCWLGSTKEDICRAWVGSKVRWDGYPRMSVRGRQQLFILVKAFGVEGTFTTCLDRRLSLSVSVSIYFSFFPLLACVSDPVKTESLPCSMKDDLHYPAL